jgi:tripartite-type tricarboxylate transporter receptor subunit TctC
MSDPSASCQLEDNTNVPPADRDQFAASTGPSVVAVTGRWLMAKRGMGRYDRPRCFANGVSMPLPRALAALLVLVATGPAESWAQAWPSRPVRLIVPVVAGGSTDVATRLIAEHLSRAFGQQFIVENRTGAGGNAGIEAVGRSAPDGYTILVTSDRVASGPHVFKLAIDPSRDLTPVIHVLRQPVVLAVHHSLGVGTLAQFLALAKEQPGMSYATAGVGIQQHVVGEWFQKLAGIKLTVVPYRGGAQAINDLIAGHVKIGSLGSLPLIPHYKAGTLRLLAQSTAERSPGLEEVPTFRQAGFDALVLDQWVGVFVPAGTPAAIVDRLNAEINKVLADAAVRASFLQQAQEPVGGTIEHATRLFREEFEKYGRLIKELNIKAE